MKPLPTEDTGQPAEPDAAPAAGPALRSGFVILAVDDDPLVLRTIEAMLTRIGCRVLTAANGKEALRVFDSERPDLVVTDIFMPEQDGLETIKALRRRDPRLPIVAISGQGHSGVDYLLVAKKFGASATLQKPFTGPQLARAIMEARQ